ncbi:hypothetical protein APHAL10511_003547 [Amanita phalloides]|nr:hypothetical protein APHAL10511_003547 [Amanita phalloides]
MSAYNTTVRATEKRVIADYNTKLLFKILDLELKHADVNIWFWDSNAAFTDILDNPKAYGFKDATSYGSNPAYFWGNNYHPGSTAHKIFASKISQLLSHPLWY